MTTKPQDNLRNGEPCADGVTCVVSIAAAEEAAAHIDAQDVKIKALVEAGTDLLGAIDMLMPKDGPAKLRMRAALAAAKETT